MRWPRTSSTCTRSGWTCTGGTLRTSSRSRRRGSRTSSESTRPSSSTVSTSRYWEKPVELGHSSPSLVPFSLAAAVGVAVSRVAGAEGDLGLSDAFVSRRFSLTAFATTPTGRPRSRASSSCWRSCECLSCSSLEVGKGHCSWEEMEVPREPGRYSSGLDFLGPEALVKMRCHRAKASTWASGVGAGLQCRAPWLYVSSSSGQH